jgi:ribosomal protein L11 methyltransferase
MDYHEVEISVTPLIPGVDIVISELAEQGYESFVEISTGVQAYIPSKDFNEEALKTLPILKDDAFKISYNVKFIKEQNWNETWEKGFQPIIIKDCIVRAPFHKLPKEFKYDILIEPKMAFGTGHHETTALMIECMLSLDLNNKTVLDMGCGTSVLAILAEKLGASDILAIDVEEWAVKNSLENISLNNAHKIKVLQGDASVLGKTHFNTILANINRNVLLKDIQLYEKVLLDNGELLLSGFFDTDIDKISKAANDCGLKLKKQDTRNGWAQLYFTKGS